MDRAGSRPPWGSAPGAKLGRQASKRMTSGSRVSTRSLKSVSSGNTPPPPKIAQEPKCLMQTFEEEDSASCCDQGADGEQVPAPAAAQELEISDRIVSILETTMVAMKKNPDKFHVKLSPQMTKLLKGLLKLDDFDDEAVVPLSMICAAIVNAKPQPSFFWRLINFLINAIKTILFIFQILVLFSLVAPFLLAHSHTQALPPV